MSVDWELTTLAGCSENLDKLRKPITKSKREAGSIPYYGASGIVDHVANYIFDEDLLLVSEDGANLLARTYPIAFSISGKTWVNNHAHVLRFSDRSTQKFVEYYLNSISLEPWVSGMAQPKLNQTKLNEIPIPLPPLSEQIRIVAILDEAFASIDQAKANTERNLANARELFDSYLNRVFEEKGEGWERVTLPECSTNLDKSRKPITKSKREPGSIPYYGASGVVDHVKDHIFDEDLLLISEDGANLLARTYPIAFSISGKTWVNNHAHVLRFDDERTRRFVEFYLNSISLEPWVSGMAQPKLNQTKLNSIPIPQPTLDEQGHIVELLENVSNSAKELKLKGKEKLASLGLLKQSILKKAFAGELTSNPDKVLNEVGV